MKSIYKILLVSLISFNSMFAVMTPDKFQDVFQMMSSDESTYDQILTDYGHVLPQAGFMAYESGWLEKTYDKRNTLFKKDNHFRILISKFFTKSHSPILLPSKTSPLDRLTPKIIGQIVGYLLQSETTLSEAIFPSERIFFNKEVEDIISNAKIATINPNNNLFPYVVYYTLTSFLITKFSTKQDIYNYLKGIKETFPAFPSRDDIEIRPGSPVAQEGPGGAAAAAAEEGKTDIYERNKPQEKFQLMAIHKFAETFHGKLTFADRNRIIEYGIQTFSQGNIPPALSLENVSVNETKFTDCTENAVRFIASLLLWNFETKKIDSSVVPSVKGVFKEFFDGDLMEVQTMKSQETSQKWAELVSNQDGIDYLKDRCELIGGEANFVKILGISLGLPEAIVTFDQLGEHLTKENRTITFSKSEADERKDLYIMTITVPDSNFPDDLDEKNEYSVVIDTKPGHSEASYGKTSDSGMFYVPPHQPYNFISDNLPLSLSLLLHLAAKQNSNEYSLTQALRVMNITNSPYNAALEFIMPLFSNNSSYEVDHIKYIELDVNTVKKLIATVNLIIYDPNYYRNIHTDLAARLYSHELNKKEVSFKLIDSLISKGTNGQLVAYSILNPYESEKLLQHLKEKAGSKKPPNQSYINFISEIQKIINAEQIDLAKQIDPAEQIDPEKLTEIYNERSRKKEEHLCKLINESIKDQKLVDFMFDLIPYCGTFLDACVNTMMQQNYSRSIKLTRSEGKPNKKHLKLFNKFKLTLAPYRQAAGANGVFIDPFSKTSIDLSFKKPLTGPSLVEEILKSKDFDLLRNLLERLVEGDDILYSIETSENKEVLMAALPYLSDIHKQGLFVEAVEDDVFLLGEGLHDEVGTVAGLERTDNPHRKAALFSFLTGENQERHLKMIKSRALLEMILKMTSTNPTMYNDGIAAKVRSRLAEEGLLEGVAESESDDDSDSDDDDYQGGGVAAGPPPESDDEGSGAE